MIRRIQSAPAARLSSPRASLAAWVCLLLLLLGSTVQAVHAHGSVLPAGAAHVSTDAGSGHLTPEDLCPLCAAMHGLAAGLPYLPATVLRATIVAIHPDPAPQQTRLWTFDLFGRPPPALL